MTQKFVWSELKKLVTIDTEIQNINREIDREKNLFESLSAQLSSLEVEIETEKKNLRDLKKEIDQAELEIKILKETDKKKQTALEFMHNPKEYGALEKELEVLEQGIDAREDKVLALLDRMTALEKRIAASGKALIDAQGAIHEQRTAIQNNIEQLHTQAALHKQSWNEQLPLVPEELAKTYTELQKKVSNTVVPVRGDSCSACFFQLLGQDINALSKKSIIRCKGCYRFLYLD